MLHRKLLLRRLAYVPWLLAVGLVLGWSGEAVADPIDVTGHGKPKATHTHATDPYLVLDHRMVVDTDNQNARDDMLFVSWSDSFSKNYNTGSGAAATSYVVSLFEGEIPADIKDPDGDGDFDSTNDDDDLAIEVYSTGQHANISTTGQSLEFMGALATATPPGERDPGTSLDVRSDTLHFALDTAPATGPGFYWVRMKVTVPHGDNAGSSQAVYFAKQIVVGPDYILTVNPSTVREDAGETEIEVTVEHSGAKKATATRVPLVIATNQPGQDRFNIPSYPTITIPADEKEGKGTITFTPINDNDRDPAKDLADDDLLVTIRTRRTSEINGSTDIRMVDADKASTAISLSVSEASLNRNAGRTEIVVTATLNGSSLDKDLRFFLRIDETYKEGAKTSVNRNVDYEDDLYPITIRGGRLSGTTTISITPLNKGLGLIRLIGSDPVDILGSPVYIRMNEKDTTTPIRIVGSSIDLTEHDPSRSPSALTAMPFLVREDAVAKEVTLEITLKDPLSRDVTVRFRVEGGRSELQDELREEEFKEYLEAVNANRDTEYKVDLPAIFIPRGETKGTGTMVVRPVNNNVRNELRVFRVVARINDNFLAAKGILITDDDTTSDSITLEVSPEEISEGADPTEITVTGTLHGKVFDDAVLVGLTIEGGFDGSAARDSDYRTSVPPLVIPGGSTEGSMTFTITPLTDSEEEDDEKIRLVNVRKPTAEDENGNTVELDVKPATITLKDIPKGDEADDPSQPAPQDPTLPTFISDEINGQLFTYIEGIAIDPLVLPEATGDDTPFTYNLFSSGLPAGLAFDPATRTLSGTPTAATDGAVTVLYVVNDSDGDAGVPLTFSITVNAAEVPPPTADAEIMATPSSIREDAGTTQISLIVSLMAAKDTDERITFTIVGPSEGKAAVRDLDYDATLGAVVTIPAGETVGTTTLTLTPMNNTKPDGLRALGVQAAFASGATLVQDIEIADDETPSTSVKLSVSPNTINEKSAETTVTVTATLDGEALAEDVNVILSVDATSTASRDVDYAAEFNPLIQILANSITGSTQFTIQPIDDDLREGTEIIKLTGQVVNNGLTGDSVEIMLADQAKPSDPEDPPEEPGDGSLAFAADAEVADQSYTAGTAIDDLVLPTASGGTGTLTYSVLSVLPAGLAFDADTRTLSGTPSAATDGAVVVIYTVADEAAAVDLLTFSITVNPALSTSFGFAAEVDDQTYTAGTAIDDLVLPAASGGTGTLTYSILTTLPAGLEFDAATRTLSGTPTAATDGAVDVTYIVTDEGGSAAVLTFSITVNTGMSSSSSLAFADNTAIADQAYTAGTAIVPLVLPAASGGTGTLTYRLVGLPTGLSFDAATRTLSGTPSAATDDAVDVTYIVADEGGAAAFLTFSIKVNPGLVFGDLFGSGKVVPTASHDLAKIREFVVGQRVEGLTLPEGTGGTAPLTYTLSPALPVGLTFDVATRTIAGTPRAASETVYTYTVTDANGASASLSLQTLPAAFSLANNFPNPFNPATTIKYALPQAADVELTVYNVVGQVVRTLVAEHQSAGRYVVEWDATNDSGHSLSAGMYFYRLQAGEEFHEVKKMLLLK